MNKLTKSLGRLLRRRPRVTMVVCSSCRQQMTAETMQRVVRDVSDLDDFRQDLAVDDPVKNQFLTEIEKQYVRGMADVHRNAVDPRFGSF